MLRMVVISARLLLLIRKSETLLALITEWILPGTTIISDCWRSYDCLEDEGYVHLKVVY